MTCWASGEPEMRWKMRCPEKKSVLQSNTLGGTLHVTALWHRLPCMKKQQFKASIPWGGGHHLSAQQWHSWDIGLSLPWIELDK